MINDRTVARRSSVHDQANAAHAFFQAQVLVVTDITILSNEDAFVIEG